MKILLALTILSCGNLSAEIVYHVSPDGDDRAPGSSEQPFSTLERARAAVAEEIAKGLQEDVTVSIHGGRYELTAPLVLDRRDSGTADHAITWQARAGEKVEISGSRRLSGKWQRVQDNLWKMPLPAAAEGKWVFRQLFREGKGQQRAREPDTGFFTLKSVDATRREVTISETMPETWSSLAGVELNTTAWWHFNRQKVAAIDARKSLVTALRPVGSDASSFKFGAKGHERIWLENALAFADEPGEWFLDPSGGMLYFRSNEGDDPNSAVFSAPILKELIIVRGEANNLVRNIRFSGLDFTETDWEMPEEDRLGLQAGAWGDRRRTFTPTAALRFIYAWDTVVENCRFRELGEGAVAFEIGTRSGKVERCEFTRVGANVIQVGRMPDYVGDRHPLHRDFSNWGDWADSLESFPASQAIWVHTSSTVQQAPSRIELSENTISDCCHIDYGSVGIWIGYANHIQVEYNTINDLPYTAISVGWRWGPGLTNCHSNLIARNRISRVMRQVGDGAGIYLVGEQPGTRIVENLINDVGGNYWAHGIYTDESSDHMEISGNQVGRVR